MLNDADAAGLEAEISAATKIYLELEQDLTRHMALGFADVETAVGALLEARDEFGAEHTLALLAERPEVFGARIDTAASLDVALLLEAVVEAQDALDALAHRQQLGDGQDRSSTSRFFIHGQDFTIDADREMAWPTAVPDRPVPFAVIEPSAVAPELGGFLAGDNSAAPAEPLRAATEIDTPAVKKKGMFANFKPPIQPGAQSIVPAKSSSPLAAAVERLAVAYADLRAVTDAALTVGPAASVEMERNQPGSIEILESALKYDPAARGAFEGPPIGATGGRRGDALVEGLERERQARLDPAVRAGRLIERLDIAFKALAAESPFDREATAAAELAVTSVIADIAGDLPAQGAMRAHPALSKIDPHGALGQALREPDLVRALTEAVDPPGVSTGHGFGV